MADSGLSLDMVIKIVLGVLCFIFIMYVCSKSLGISPMDISGYISD